MGVITACKLCGYGGFPLCAVQNAHRQKSVSGKTVMFDDVCLICVFAFLPFFFANLFFFLLHRD